MEEHLMEEIDEKIFSRRYHRFKDMRRYSEACRWAKALDWRRNPCDRFLLRRELLHHLEATEVYFGPQNIFTFATRGEIAEEVERLMDQCPNDVNGMGVFGYVLHMTPWNLAIRHERVKLSKLSAALLKLPDRLEGRRFPDVTI
jgi:hypothetical protein